MAYPAYDNYNNQYAYPPGLSQSLSHGPVYGVHPTEYAYSDPAYTGAYGEVSIIHLQCRYQAQHDTRTMLPVASTLHTLPNVASANMGEVSTPLVL